MACSWALRLAWSGQPAGGGDDDRMSLGGGMVRIMMECFLALPLTLVPIVCTVLLFSTVNLESQYTGIKSALRARD